MRSAAARYTFAVFAALAALLLREALSPFFGHSNPYHTVWAAVVFSAWYCGLGPAIVTTLLSLLGVLYLFLPPMHSFSIQDPRNQVPGMVGFLVLSSFIIALGESNRRSKAKLEKEVQERQRAEQELRETDRELNQAQQLARMGSWTWEPQTGTVLWSDELYRMSGRDPSLPAPRYPELHALFTPDSWQRLQTAVDSTLKTGTGYDIELEMIRPDGSIIQTMTHASAERDASGRIVKLVGSIQDITENKRAENTLRENEERLRIALKAGKSGSWEWNFQTQRIYSSPELRELYGFPLSPEIQDRELFRARIHPDDLGGVDRILTRLLETHGTDYHAEFRINRPDGAVRWLEATARVFYDERQNPTRIVGVVTDITERKSSEDRERRMTIEALAATAKFRAVFEQTTVFAAITTVDGTVIDANQLCLEACGYRAEDVLGRPFWQTGWWSHSEEVQEKIRLGTEEAAQGNAYREILTYHWADGTERLVDFSLHPIRDSQGVIIFLHPTGVDITDLKATEDRLQKAHDELEHRVQERTGELAETVASLESEMMVRQKVEHDLRLLSARVLRLQDEERRRIARDLHDSTGQTLAALRMSLGAAEKLVNPAAAPSLAEANQLANQALQEIRTTSYLLHPPLLDEVGFASAAQWYVDGFTSRSGIQANLQLSQVPQLPKEFELVLFRILQESLTNVLRHSESPTVDISLTADEENAILSIRDYGKGMGSEKLASFRQTGTGVGVGLGGMKQRVRELGGHLRVDGESGGTRITATLPLSKTESIQRPADPKAPAA